ncbi:MAG: hypothetical protein KGZ81_07285 [Flavobacteriales bacterium]|nr:hypothetical protein [Flavobacteriales bacterium]
MEFHKNPTGDIYRIMDESGLTLPNLQRSDRSQTKTVQAVRLDMADGLKKYIKYRDQQIIEKYKREHGIEEERI